MSVFFSAATVTDLGLVRANNEDSAYAGRRLLVVADGMGGMPAGELASDIVVRALTPLEDTAEQPDGAGDSGDVKDPLSSLREALESANATVRQVAESDAANDGMGTTVTALLLSDDHIGLLHVGDSRCYRLRDGELAQLTRDDTYVQALVDQGLLTPAEARIHPRRSVVTQAVQGHDLEPTCTTLTPAPSDRFLLCSDGLSDIITDDVIAEALRANSDPKQCAAHLVSLALRAGAPDNVTVIVGDINPS